MGSMGFGLCSTQQWSTLAKIGVIRFLDRSNAFSRTQELSNGILHRSVGTVGGRSLGWLACPPPQYLAVIMQNGAQIAGS